MFGRRKTDPQPDRLARFQAPRDSDGKRRVFGEAVFAEHGDFLRQLGFELDAPGNILPEAEDFDALVKQSLIRQDQRRSALEAKIKASFGQGLVRPYFIFGDGVLNGDHGLGHWLIRSVNLLPYDEWNVIYLAMDMPTAKAIDMPLHPEHSIDGLDAIVAAKLPPLREQFSRVIEGVLANFSAHGNEDWFDPWKAQLRQTIIDYADTLRPMIVAMIADAQAKAA